MLNVARTSKLWSAVTCYRFRCSADSSVEQSRVQRLAPETGRAWRIRRRQVASAKRGQVRALQNSQPGHDLKLASAFPPAVSY